MAVTAREYVTDALVEAGVTGMGQTPNDIDINNGFKLLHRMLAQWQKRRWLVPNLIDVYAPGNGLKSNLIGPGGYYNSARPDKIQAAYFKQLNFGGGFSDGFSDGFDIGSGGNNVSYPLRPIWSYEEYSRIALKELTTWPTHYFYDNAFPFGNVFIWPIPTSAYEVHLIVKGPIGFTIELQDGSISDAGFGYTDGIYANVSFINISSFGGGGTADFTVSGGIVTNVVINNAGDGYKINDTLSVLGTDLGGGAGFIWRVDNVTDSLDAEFNMPAEYEEAIYYNLVIRIAAGYQKPLNPAHGKLALIALNTIKVSNLQLSKLQMPTALQFNRGSGFYIFNADQF